MPRPATGKTPVRHIRIPDHIWEPTKEKAAAEGRPVAEVVNAYLRRYISTPPRVAATPGGASDVELAPGEVLVRVLTVFQKYAHLETEDHPADDPLRVEAVSIARDADLTVDELTGRRLVAIRDGEQLSNFRLADSPPA